MTKKINREYKDGVFRTLFNEKEKMLELYNAVSGTDYGKEMVEKLEVLTIEDPIYIGIRNDLAFIMPDRAIFFTEHQSTLCGNIAIRMAAYFGEVLQKLFDDEIYRTKKLNMPPPEFYVLYNGGKETPQEQIFRLSDHYIEKPLDNSAEVVVKFINICYSETKDILKKSKTLREYSLLMAYIDDNIRSGMERESAIEAAISRAYNEQVLTEFLRKNASEVLGMLHGEVTMERYGEIRYEEGVEDAMGKIEEKVLESRKEGLEEGLKEGRNGERLTIAKNLKKIGVSAESIAEATGLSVKEIEKL